MKNMQKKQWTLNKCMAFLMRFSFQFILLIIVENSQQQQKFIKLFIKFEILLWIETNLKIQINLIELDSCVHCFFSL